MGGRPLVVHERAELSRYTFEVLLVHLSHRCASMLYSTITGIPSTASWLPNLLEELLVLSADPRIALYPVEDVW